MRQNPDPYGESEGYVAEKRTNGYNHDHPPARNRRFSVVRLWAGGFAVALVAALAAAVAVLLVRGVLDIPVFAPEREGTMVLASTGQLALGAALAALAATAVLQLLLLATPQPGRFLAWIIVLGTAAAMLAPFNSLASWEAKAGTAGVYLVIGVVIGTLMSTVARSASRS
jgi:drug/metabolite transporter (DMT)-like permease